MIAGELKSRVDAIWDTLWAGGLANPIGAVSQITYLLFIKLLDDEEISKEANANTFGVEVVDPTFDQEHQNCRWSVFKTYGPEEMFNNMTVHVFPFIKEGLHAGKTTAFARYMKDAIFQIPSPKVLERCVQLIDSLDLENKDLMGDMYEYLLQRMAAQKIAGSFRTPTHIIDMMVALAKPTPEDKICDPAMGTAGFLASCAMYIRKHYADELMKTGVRKYYQTEMFTGSDISETMVQIAAMNLMLHGVDDPNLMLQDSLAEEGIGRNKFSLVMANPPFAGGILDIDAICKDLVTVSARAKKTELLFIALFTRLLKVGGRCLSIVPDGVLFGSSTSHVAIRKHLVEDQMLQAVISMPSGVFQPYAGVKTSILIFTKTDRGGTGKVWFYNMKNDGFSLDAKRSPVEGSDIPDVIARFHNLAAEESRTRKDQSFLVPIQEIRDNGYDLSMNKYIETERETKVYRPTSEIMDELKRLQAEAGEMLSELEEMLKKDDE